jgi:hypothetical protein
MHLLILTISLSTLWVFSACAEGKKGELLIGGECEYKRYKGRAEILSVIKKSGPDINLQEKYEVKFLFTTDREIKETYAQLEGKEFLLLLSNSSYPGPGYLEKYGIEVGRVFDCYLKVIVKGTCTPVLFEFPFIRLDDYFEN